MHIYKWMLKYKFTENGITLIYGYDINIVAELHKRQT